ncbi:putative bifunctional diguanylate cyclase/phosphodiesterase [endosymbiont of Ridgeia piscesae]|uniref:cyclic-guanylate-specific phosphodiesterase n=1 Tax=endosymbiont of Ridgeia piscesae TaxID=54398 RepID=A0A0T5YXM7_9GAMM|nr:EAL domain-containing protein [endosymbiont of Ridgeia piscesae]KRT54958.1 PAS domain S-box/diguanylate cyclase (GGDEF) domain [endosymbiont of Ridgeia piscesae]KRT58386.1 PAS domain S-box-containing protein/diguanylate cyclase (GGDEF) domain-containing protein [endosymbiont of Ridgeia piscesae]
MKGLQLQSKYSLTLLALVIGVVLSVSSVLLYQFDDAIGDYQEANASTLKRAQIKQLQHQGLTLTGILAQSLINPLYELDMEGIGQLLQTANSQPDVIRTLVFDEKGRIVHDGEETLPRFGQLMSEPLAFQALQSQAPLTHLEADRLSIAAPISLEKNQLLGGIYIDLSLSQMLKVVRDSKSRLELISRTHIDRNLNSIWMLLLLLGAASILAGLLIAYRLSRPIGRLEKLAQRIGSRDYSAVSHIDRNDEIGSLARTLEKMGQHLQSTTISKEYMDEILHSMRDLLLVTDLSGRITRINRAFSQLSGYTSQQAISQSIGQIIPYSLDKHSSWAEYLEEPHEVSAHECTLQASDGKQVPILLSASMLDPNTGHQGMVLVAQDLTEYRVAQQQIHHLAYYDLVTGLPNRALFIDRLRQAIRSARREQNRMALFFLDLDRFKNINDTLGHEIGDQMLEAVAARLQSHKREEDTIARFGGDEFTLIIPRIEQTDDLITQAERITSLFQQPFNIGGLELFSGTSIGISLYPDDASDAETLIRNADTAMYRSKERRSNGFEFYTDDMNTLATEFMNIEHGLRRALENQAFELRYQPQVNIKTGKLKSVEALLRWRRSEHEILKPDLFLHVLEETGLVIPVGEWVLRQACRQLKAWQQLGVRIERVAVNISPRQFVSPNLAETVSAILKEYQLPASSLELEITESGLMEDMEHTIELLGQLADMGVKLAIDDFGTGYSSLEHLRNFPVQTLKIDRSFIHGMETEQNRAAIVQAIISLANILDLKVVAEGVETKQQQALLEEFGCRIVQGYLYSLPLMAEEIPGVTQHD